MSHNNSPVDSLYSLEAGKWMAGMQSAITSYNNPMRSQIPMRRAPRTTDPQHDALFHVALTLVAAWHIRDSTRKQSNEAGGSPPVARSRTVWLTPGRTTSARQTVDAQKIQPDFLSPVLCVLHPSSQ